MIKFNLLLILLIYTTFFILPLKSQQNSSWSSFYENGFVWNPALTARWNTWEVSSTYRKEWTGFKGAPENGTLGFQYPFIKRFTTMTVGGFLEHDNVGPFQSTGVAGTYCYKIRPRFFGRRDDVLSFGIKAGLYQYNFDPYELVAYDQPEGDPLLPSNVSSTVPDFAGGIFYTSVSDFYSYKSHYYAGLAVNKILPLQVKSYLAQPITNTVHINIHGGYRYFPFRAKYYLEPNVFVNYAFDRPMNIMAATRFEMIDKFWLSAGAVTNGDVFGQLGVIFDKKSMIGSIVNDGTLRMGVKVDYSMGGLRRYSGVGYEFYMAYLFSNEPY